MRTITERLVKRMRKGQMAYNPLIVQWSERYAVSRFLRKVGFIDFYHRANTRKVG